jgi:signal transduction histidine kinase/class 3 adenylate cyclase
MTNLNSAYNPMSEGYQSEVIALDTFIRECLQTNKVQDLVRLNTYLRRYFSPLVTRDLFRQKQLPLPLKQQQVESIVALVLDIRGFVRTTQSGERTSEGLDAVARLLRDFFSHIIQIAFKNRGLVGEFAGDRVMITFGFPPDSSTYSMDTEIIDELTLNVGRAIQTAFAIQQMSQSIRADESFPISLRRFEVGIGICAGGPAWVGDIGNNGHGQYENSWRQELTIISTAINIAARAEELTKDEQLLIGPEYKIVVDKTVIDEIKQLLEPHDFAIEDLGVVKVRGLDDSVHLFQFIHLTPGILPSPEPISEQDHGLVNWICEHIDGAIERDVFGQIHRSLLDVGQVISASVAPDEQIVFEQIMERIINSFAAKKVTLYRVDPINKELVVVNSKGSEPLFARGTRLPADKGIAGHVATIGQGVMSTDVHTDALWGGRVGTQFDPSIHAMMCVPLKAGERVVGIIQVMDNRVGIFSETNFISLQIFAEMATVVLENMRVARARTIITNALALANTLDEVLDAVMVAIEETLMARNATLYLIDQENGELIFKRIISESQNPPLMNHRLLPGTGIVGRVVDTKKEIIIFDTTTDPNWYGKIGSDMRSMICVPLIANQQVVGAIQVLHELPYFFNVDQLEILKWLSASAAVAVSNAAQLEQARRKLVASQAMVGMGAIAGKLAHNLKNHVTAISTIARYELHAEDEDTQSLIEEIIELADLAQDEVNSFTQPLTDWRATNVDLNTALMQVISEIGEWIKTRQAVVEVKSQVDIQYEPTDGQLFVYAGKEQLKYIFRNLLDNAWQAIQDKGQPQGRIMLRLSLERIGDRDWAVVQVEDTGKGFRDEDRERVFERDYTTRKTGTIGGYGLFWVRLNVESIGGRITAKGEPSVRAVFQVRLPLANVQAEGKINES